MSDTNTTFTLPDFSTLWPTLSPDMQAALGSRGFSHVFGNEVASRVHTRAVKEVKGDSKDDPTKEAVKAWKDANAETIGNWTLEVQAEKLAELQNGTLGQSTAGPRLTPLDSMKRVIARKEVVAILAKANIKAPTGDKTINLKGEDLTMADLVARRLANPDHAARIEKEANKAIADQAKKAKAIGDSTTGDAAADLGL